MASWHEDTRLNPAGYEPQLAPLVQSINLLAEQVRELRDTVAMLTAAARGWSEGSGFAPRNYIPPPRK